MWLRCIWECVRGREQQELGNAAQLALLEIISLDLGFLSYFRWVPKYSNACVYRLSAWQGANSKGRW